MRIVITGATGFIGTPVSASLILKGHELTILTRRIRRTASRSARVRHVEWNPADETSFIDEIDGCDAVVNLAGENIAARRWTRKQKERILKSRILATRGLVRSIQRASQRPRVLINASAMGYYGPRGDELLDETASSGEGFLASTCKAWEAHAVRAEEFGVRVVRLRIGVVLGKEGGALAKMVPPFKLFLGGWLGSGKQWMSWIHLEDVVRLIDTCLNNDGLRGPVNVTAPEPVTNKVFSTALAQVLRRPCLMPVPPFALRLLLGEMADELLLKGQRVIPKKALDAGFEFRFPKIHRALEHILGAQK